MRIVFWYALLMPILITGCDGSKDAELRAWMGDLRASTKPHVTPLTEPKKFAPQAYLLESGVEPFNSIKLTQALKKDSTELASNASLIAPEMARRKEPLEAYPLDAMAMVGSMDKNSVPTALLRVNGLIYPVRVGNYIGQNYGKIMHISENVIRLREIVQDPAGDWVERTTSLELLEGVK